MNRPSYKELWLDECKDRDEQLQWIRNAVNGNAKFRNSEPPYSEEEELARKIMQMHSRIAELEADRRWIPVSERLPKENAPVLVLTVLGGMFVDFIHGKSVVTGNPDFYELDVEDVTHWMPLPQLPEVQE